MTGDIWSLLGTNLAVIVAVLTLLSLPAALTTKDPSYIDGIWGPGFVVVALSSFLQTDGDPARSALLLGLTALWGLRLGAYLLWRRRRQGPDARYQKVLGPHPSAVAIWVRVFLLKWSGVGPLESQLKDSKPKYVDYIATTSGFVPLPKRNAPVGR